MDTLEATHGSVSWRRMLQHVDRNTWVTNLSIGRQTILPPEPQQQKDHTFTVCHTGEITNAVPKWESLQFNQYETTKTSI